MEKIETDFANSILLASKADLSNVANIAPNKNLFDWRSSILGKCISVNGVITENSNYGISNYIPFNGKNIYSEYGTAGGTTAEIYDENFVKIATIQAGTKLFKYQIGYSYLRFCFFFRKKKKFNTSMGIIKQNLNNLPHILIC